ncbi:MAG TPA: hypothetical protein PLH01_06315, partial [Kiritimatiellia bacterium]|nr:hypothetical protein [Kiritimatiellia bacterium]HOR98637.1 hypothetical protein [Kiritimatiellia bacterium]HPK37877.1 hypothetical protein [Kiritimatiellia bacterium]
WPLRCPFVCVTQFDNMLSHREDNTTRVVLRVMYPLVRKMQEHFLKKVDFFSDRFPRTATDPLFFLHSRAAALQCGLIHPTQMFPFSSHVYETLFS